MGVANFIDTFMRLYCPSIELETSTNISHPLAVSSQIKWAFGLFNRDTLHGMGINHGGLDIAVSQ